MESNHKLALYVCYYLARFNEEALEHLEYKTWNDAFDDIAKKLQVKRLSVQNWRDEFDPLFGHRAGWHQRAMIPSRTRVAQALENLDEFPIRKLVKDILSGKIRSDKEEEQLLLSIISETGEARSNRQFISRGPTGKAAEDCFIRHFSKYAQPLKGELNDCRDLGCGYDFMIKSDDLECYIEVKGLAEISGGLLFTNKEWQTAVDKGNNYFLCVVRGISKTPELMFVKNPMEVLSPSKHLYSTIQISWSVTEKDLNKLEGTFSHV